MRLQCYEGLDDAKALYEWEYAKQLLYTQLLKDKIAETIAGAATLSEAAERIAGSEDLFFSERFLLPRPILAAIRSKDPALLLVDEIDKADPEFEAFLLEVLADSAVTVPELGTVRAVHTPRVVLTSNAARELSDALKRRCLHLDLLIDVPGVPDPHRLVAHVGELHAGLLVRHQEPAARSEQEIDRGIVDGHSLFLRTVAVLTDLDEDRARRDLPRADEPERLQLGVGVRPRREIVPLDAGSPLQLRDHAERLRMREPARGFPVLAHHPRQVLLQRCLREEDVRRLLVEHGLHAGLGAQRRRVRHGARKQDCRPHRVFLP